MFLEFCEIFQNNFLTEKLWMSAFDQSMKFLKLPKMLLHIFFENTVYKKLVMTDICNDCEILNNQICIVLL